MVVTRLSHSRSSETREISLFRVTQIVKVATGCPIALQEAQQMPFAPQAGPYDGQQAAEAMRPVGEESQVAQQEIDQQRDPNLPSHRVGRGAQKVGQLQ